MTNQQRLTEKKRLKKADGAPAPLICHLSSVHNAFDTRILWKECCSVAQAGYDVKLIACPKEDNSCPEVTIDRFPSFKHRLTRFSLAPWWMLFRALKTRAALYHFHDPELLPIGLLLRLLTRKPVVYDVHEDVSASIRVRAYIPKFLRKPLAKAYRVFENVACRFMTVVIAEKYYADFLPRSVTVLNYPILDSDSTFRIQSSKLEKETAKDAKDANEEKKGDPLSANGCQGRDPNNPRPTISDACAHWLFYSGSVTGVRGALHHARIAQFVEGVGVYSAGRCGPELAVKMRKEASGQWTEAGEPTNGHLPPATAQPSEFSAPRADTNHPPANPLSHPPSSLIIEGDGFSVNRQRLDDLALNYHWLAGLAIFPKTDHYQRKELTKFFEYMQAGIPILCSNMAAWKEFVEGQGIGLTVDPENADDQKEKIQYLVDHPEECRKMGERGRHLVRTDYNWRTQAEKLLSLYESLLRP